MAQIYCGNNKNFSGLKSKTHRKGTRYECLKIGIGKGLQLPFDPVYTGDFTPIDSRKVWCGKSPKVPDTHDILGNAPMCLQKGIGIGKKKKAEEVVKIRSKPMNIQNSYFVTGIKRICKLVNSDLNMSDDILLNINKRIDKLAHKLVSLMDSKDGDVVPKVVEKAVRVLFPKELMKLAMNNGLKTLKKYKENPRRQINKLIFKASYAKRILKERGLNPSNEASVFLADVLEYITTELIEGVSEIARSKNKTVVSRSYVTKAISSDADLKNLFGK